ncbi:MAG: hypothetical protein ACRDJW_07915 [Thermomicrobiales bacterium]
MTTNRDPGLLPAAVADGRPLLQFTALGLVLSGGFALFLAAGEQFLPHDVAHLGMSADDLCAIAGCRVVDFMFHDRVAFGGAIISIGLLYLWLIAFPLSAGEAWAWWTLAVSGTVGFGSFLAYLGFGYLDTWHLTATLALLPCFFAGVLRARTLVSPLVGIRVLLEPGTEISWRTAAGIGRVCLLATALGMIGGGLTITLLGMTRVFVPQDIDFIGLEPAQLRAINDRLVPVIAHDRAGYGGATMTAGIITLLCIWCGRPTHALWQVLFLAGLVGFGCAIGIHPIVGYDDLVHLAPAIIGALLLTLGLTLSYRPMHTATIPARHEVAPETRDAHR